jgi:hypothetical protein
MYGLLSLYLYIFFKKKFTMPKSNATTVANTQPGARDTTYTPPITISEDAASPKLHSCS